MARPPQPTLQIEIGTEGNDSIVGFVAIPAQFEGRGGDDTLQGSVFSDTLLGGDGNDELDDQPFQSTPTADTLIGGAGDDSITAGVGGTTLDVLDGGEGFDRLSLTFAPGFTADLTQTGRFGDGGTVTLSNGQALVSFESVFISLGAGDDALTAGRLGAAFGGNGGDDTLTGLNGGDNFDGGEGDDSLVGGGGNDFLSGGFGDDTVRGGNGNDFVTGLIGRDIVDGGRGNDTVSGAFATGGRGADVFTLPTFGGQVNRVLDFSLAEGDRVQTGTFAPRDPDEIFSDVFGDGFVRVIDGVEGAEVQFRLSGNFEPDEPFVTALILVGVVAADLPDSAFFTF